MSDPDPEFMSKFWRALWKRMGLELKMNTLFWPQIDGKNQESELGYLIILIELCGGVSIILGGPFGVGRILLQQLGAFDNRFHSFSNGDEQVTNCAYNLGCTWATPKRCKWGGVDGDTTWWRHATLMRNGQGKFWKGAQIIQGFCGQVLTRGEFWRTSRSVVEHKKIPVVKRFEPQVLGPICDSIQSVGKEISRHLQVRTIEKP